MFDFPWRKRYQNCLKEPNTALLTKDVARNISATGGPPRQNHQTRRNPDENNRILNTLPANTDFPLKAVLSYATVMNYVDMSNWETFQTTITALSNWTLTARKAGSINCWPVLPINTSNP